MDNRRGLNIGVFGGMGSGKTHFITTQLLKGRKAFIFDPNEEPAYAGINNQYSGLMDIKAFAAYTNKHSTKAINVFEEATPVLKHGSNITDLTELLTRKRHRQITNVLVFHSLNTLPISVFSFLDYAVIFKTVERMNLLEGKYLDHPRLIEAVKKMQTAPKYSKVILKLK